MPAFGMISPDKLFRLLGQPAAPVIVDVRLPEDLAADPRLIPTSLVRSHSTVADWVAALPEGPVVVSCLKGMKLAQGTAALLRHFGRQAEVLEGGFLGWAAAGLPLVALAALPDGLPPEGTLWVTRSRPKIDRIACPWLIRRFIDPAAVFLFVQPSEVQAVAERFGAIPFDIEGVFWSHREERCTFEVMLSELGLDDGALAHLGRIVGAADTGRLANEPQAAGLLAAALGFSRLHGDDLAQMHASFPLYDAFYRWCRDATDETHTWPHKRKGETA